MEYWERLANLNGDIQQAEAEDISSFLGMVVSLVRGGIAESGRMEYSFDDPVFVAFNDMNRCMVRAMDILKTREVVGHVVNP